MSEASSTKGDTTSQPTVSVTAPVPSKGGKFSASSIRAKLVQHVGTSSKSSTSPSGQGGRPSVAVKGEMDSTALHSSQRNCAGSASDPVEVKAYDVPQYARAYPTFVPTGSTHHSLSSHSQLIVTSFAATALLSVLLSRVHWSLAIAAVAASSYILHKILASHGEDVAFATRIAHNEGRWLKADKVESVEWINHILGLVWPLITADVFMPFVDLLEDALQLQVPGIVHAVRVEDVDQGVIPLKIGKFKVLGRSEDDFLGERRDTQVEDNPLKEEEEERVDLGEHVNLEVDFFYRAPPHSRKGFTVMTANAVEEGIGPEGEYASNTPETPSKKASAEVDDDTPPEVMHLLLYLSVGLQKIAAVEVPVWCEVLGIEGRMRLRIQLVPNAPFVKHLGFTLIGQPKLELKAKPLGRKMIIDAMQLPFLSSYVLKSIQSTVAPFVSPGSYTIDVAALLGAEAGPRNTYSVGVICIILHQATELPAADTNGFSDPFVSVSFSRAGKPLFRSRVLRRTLRPTWQEVVYVPVSPDEIRDHEKVRFTVFDADRFSADDPLGKVEVSVDHLIHRALKRSNDFKSSTMMDTRTDDLQPVRRGGHSKGKLKYSIVFSKLVQPEGSDRIANVPERAHMRPKTADRVRETGEGRENAKDDQTERETEETSEFMKEQQHGVGSAGADSLPFQEKDQSLAVYETGFDRFARSLGLPMNESLLKARKARHERVRRLVDMLAGEQAAIVQPPDSAWPTGILAFHVHSIQQLEVSQTQRSYKSANLTSAGSNEAVSTSGGGESTNGISSKMPSSYVQILLNDEPILRTRTKTYNARPFINAGSERVVGDFRTARMDFVVRDSRQREGDPILGVVGFRVADVLKASARKTDWYTLTGGLGCGKMQITLLWRSIQLQVPASLRGWNLGVLEVSKLQATVSRMFEGKDGYFSLQTPGGKIELNGIAAKRDAEQLESSSRQENNILFEADLSSRSIRLPVRQRYPGQLVIILKSGARTPGRRRPQAVLCACLSRLVDNVESTFRVPLWVSQDWYQVEQGLLKATSSDQQLFGGGREEYRQDDDEEEKQGSALEELCRGATADLPNELPYEGGKFQRAGFVDLTVHFFSGLAEEHRSLRSGDHELRYAHEAWQTMVDCKERALPKRASNMDRGRGTSSSSAVGPTSLYEPSILDIRSDEDETIGDDVESEEDRLLRRRILHRQERGAAQIKGFRTASWLKQNINDGIGRAKRLAGEQGKRLSKMEDEGVSSI